MSPQVPQSVKDALADAETLRLYSDAEDYLNEVWMAGHFGSDAAFVMTRRYQWVSDEADSYYYARRAAQRAFAAVPALRDEEES